MTYKFRFCAPKLGARLYLKFKLNINPSRGDQFKKVNVLLYIYLTRYNFGILALGSVNFLSTVNSDFVYQSWTVAIIHVYTLYRTGERHFRRQVHKSQCTLIIFMNLWHKTKQLERCFKDQTSFYNMPMKYTHRL